MQQIEQRAVAIGQTEHRLGVGKVEPRRNPCVVAIQFKVQRIAGCRAAVADCTDLLPLRDRIAGRNRQAVQMGVEGFPAVAADAAVVDHDIVAVAWMRFRGQYGAGGRGCDRRALRRAEVVALVVGAEIAGNVAEIHRHKERPRRRPPVVRRRFGRGGAGVF